MTMLAAFFAELMVAEMPDESVTCTMSLPASRKGVKKSTYSEMLTWEVLVSAPSFISR